MYRSVLPERANWATPVLSTRTPLTIVTGVPVTPVPSNGTARIAPPRANTMYPSGE
jgi:hypothetical protein